MTQAKMRGMTNEKNGILTRAERVALMHETGCDERSIRRWERGEPVRESTRMRLERAARKLNVVVPEASA